MKFLGPVRVLYDGPPEAEAYFASMARVRLGYLQAMRAGYHEAPITSIYEFPDGVTIRSTLTGDTGAVDIHVPRPSTRGRKRRFVTYPGFIVAAFPTSEPIRITIKPVVEKAGKAAFDLNPAHVPSYLVIKKTTVDIHERNADGEIVRLVKGTGVALGAANEYIFSEYMPMSGAFPGQPVPGTTPTQYSPVGKVVYVPVCGRAHPQILSFAPHPPPTPPSRVYTPDVIFGGHKMQCAAADTGVIYQRERY